MKVQNIHDVEFTNDNGVSLDFISHNDMYDEAVRSGAAPMILNDYCKEFTDMEVVEALNNLIRTHFGTKELDTVPSCLCRRLSNKFNEGLTCPRCHTVVDRNISRSFASELYIRPPKGVPVFISPRFMNIFTKFFGTKKFDLLEWLTCRRYVPGGRGSDVVNRDKNVRAIVQCLEKHKIKRGIRYFYNNFDRIMEVILTDKTFNKLLSGDKAKVKRDFSIIIKNYRHCIFSNRLPYPSKMIMVSEEDKSAGFIDKNMPILFNAVKNIIMLERPLVPQSDIIIESRAMLANRQFAEYYRAFRSKDVYSGKPGIARKQQGSTRSSFSGRATITGKTGVHRYDEVSTPWAWTISLLTIHIINKLFKLDFTPVEMYNYVDKCIVNSEGSDGDLMENIINTLIDEAPDRGISIAMLRNPTLERLSDQIYYITKVNRDTNINSIMMSVLAIKGKNADFDGDQLQVLLLLDNIFRARFKRLGAHLGLMDADHPRKIKGIITLHAEVITMVNNYLTDKRVGFSKDELPDDIETYEAEL